MNSPGSIWQVQTLEFSEGIHDALQQQHHAAQFIALTGRYLIKQRSDDSNTNMKYLPEENLLIGNPLSNSMSLALHLPDLVLYLLESQSILQDEIRLAGKSKKQVFEILNEILTESRIDTFAFKDELHYQMPPHVLDEDSVFTIKDRKYFQENTVFRHNAEIILNEIANLFDIAEPVRVWPHHFDTGTFIPVDYNEKGGVSKSIGLGWAIPDDMVSEPYYYISYWSENPDVDFSTLQSPGEGQWITSGWNGGILKHSNILMSSNPEKQHEMVRFFFTSGIKILSNKIK
jgi:hypothetical protein